VCSPNHQPAVYRFRITITVGPTGYAHIDVLRWMIALLLRVHDDPPGPIRVKVEPILPSVD
jgi:hypothetical protein